MYGTNTSNNFWGINHFNNTNYNTMDSFGQQTHKQQYNLNNNPNNIFPDESSKQRIVGDYLIENFLVIGPDIS